MKRVREDRSGGREAKKRKPEPEKAPYGNYHRYYGYRAPRQDDPRVEALDPAWFEGGHVLDVGCNAGNVLLSIAAHYNPIKALGVDIDPRLIFNARKSLDRMTSSKRFLEERTPKSEPPTDCQTSPQSTSNPPASNKRVPRPYAARFPDNVAFKSLNFVEDDVPAVPLYKAVLCLSITKWVHLNWGDEGLMTMFRKCFALLEPGGRLILEPQPWSSYKKKFGVTETTKEHYKTIKLRPPQFSELLLNEIGFERMDELPVVYSSERPLGSFTERPLLVFTKAKSPEGPQSE